MGWKWRIRMKKVGIARAVDELGRITIPIEMRRHLQMKTGSKVEITATSEGILINHYAEPSQILEILRSLKVCVEKMEYAPVTKEILKKNMDNMYKAIFEEEKINSLN